MSFKLVIATAYLIAGSYSLTSNTPAAVSLATRDDYTVEHECVAEAIKLNGETNNVIAAAQKEFADAMAAPREDLMHRKYPKSGKGKDMDKLTSADWHEIEAARRKIKENMRPVAVSYAFCIEKGLMDRN